MKHLVTLKNGITLPALGLGTWYLGETPSEYQQELESLRSGINAGMTLIDSAEMYGNGKAESLIKDAISGVNRDDLFLVSKVLPNHAGGKQLMKALDGSLLRMGIDHLDLYLYHWRGSYPLDETVDKLEEAKRVGKIKDWGVSNFDIDDMKELWQVPNGKNCLVNQVLYHTGSRGIEYSLLPWMREHDVALMSYCPLAQAGTLKPGMLSNLVLEVIAEKYEATVEQILLAWNIRDGHTIAIPRSSKKEHTLLNAASDQIQLTEEDYLAIDQVFLPPSRKEYLDIQ